MTIIKNGRHVCDPPEYGDPRAVWECDVCMRRWINRPTLGGFCRTLPDFFLVGRFWRPWWEKRRARHR